MIEKILMGIVGVVATTLLTLFTFNATANTTTSPLPTPKATIEYSFVDDNFLVTVKPINYYTDEVAREAFFSMHLGAEIQSLEDIESLKELGYVGYVAEYYGKEIYYTLREPKSTWVITLHYIPLKNTDKSLLTDSEKSVIKFLKSLEIDE